MINLAIFASGEMRSIFMFCLCLGLVTGSDLYSFDRVWIWVHNLLHFWRSDATTKNVIWLWAGQGTRFWWRPSAHGLFVACFAPLGFLQGKRTKIVVVLQACAIFSVSYCFCTIWLTKIENTTVWTNCREWTLFDVFSGETYYNPIMLPTIYSTKQ